MRNEILINSTSREVRVAVVENGVLQDVLIERSSHRGVKGNIYKGKVSRVLPGMQAAFLDIGMERTAFLHVADVFDKTGRTAADAGDVLPGIRELLHEGETLLAQVIKDPIGSKGARLSMHITIPSRYLVLLPGDGRVAVSSRIEDEAERERLRKTMEQLVSADSDFGYIVRTAAEGADADALQADMQFLNRLWEIIRRNGASSAPGELVHEDLSLSLRVVRDFANVDIGQILVDSAPERVRIEEFVQAVMPDAAPKVELYAGHRPLLDNYGIEEDIEKALGRKVALKSGGYIIFDQTEAMTTIDVNTGGYVGHRNLEDTIFRTNLEAAVTIARQLRLRNLGGIIIIDFIDMSEQDHREQVVEALEAALAADHARTRIHVHSSLGLVEMTRKRTRESLEQILCGRCPTCSGNGFVKTPETVCYEIFREILRQCRQFKFQELVVLAHGDVVDLLLDEESASLADLEELTGKPIRLQAETTCLPDDFDVVLM